MVQQGVSRSARPWAWTFASGLFTLALAAAALLLPALDRVPAGGVVGWMLFLAGAVEFTLGLKRGRDTVARAAIGAGLATACVGLVFVVYPKAGFLPVANLVMTWLFLRGLWVLAMARRVRSERVGLWLALGGAADLLLGVALLIGLPLTALVVGIFGPTREMVVQFAFILGVSFLVTGGSQIVIALLDRSASGRVATEGAR